MSMDVIKAEGMDFAQHMAKREATPSTPEITLDIFPELTRQVVGVPMAGILLFSDKGHRFEYLVGHVVDGVPDVSDASRGVLEAANGLMVVENIKEMSSFPMLPCMAGGEKPGFYAGASIFGPGGDVIGLLCAMGPCETVAAHKLDGLRRLSMALSATIALQGATRRLKMSASTDSLTGLLNRDAFEAVANACLESGDDESAGVVHINMDRFKSVNLLFGHEGGNSILREVARRLRASFGEMVAIARPSADDFLLLLPRITKDEAARISTLLHEMLETPFDLAGREASLGASIGISLASSSQPAMNLPSPTAMADSALQAAKRSGGGTTCVADSYISTISKAAKPNGRMNTRNMLKTALSLPGKEPFILNYQPYFDAATGELRGFEALVRWPLITGVVMPPGDFVPLAESDGTIAHIDNWGMRQACTVANTWPDHLTISVNVSAASFFSGDLACEVAEVLQDTGLPGSRLKIEVTESLLLANPGKVRETMARLRAMGVRIVLDDFGCGHSSFGYLKEYSFDTIKIDRIFVNDVETSQRSFILLRAIVGIGAALGLETVAEGVETEAQLSIIRRENVTTIQGYLLGRPMPEAQASKLARTSAP